MKSFLHKNVWQRIPRAVRRQILIGTTSALAPTAAAGLCPQEPIIVVGPLRTATGLGQAARLCYEAWQSAERNVYAIDVCKVLNQPVDFPNYSYKDGSRIFGPGTILLHVNAPFVPLILLALGSAITARKYLVGNWHWELPKVPSEWITTLRYVHEIWVPTHFVAKAVQGADKDAAVHVIPHPVALRTAGRSPRHKESSLTILLSFNAASGFTRKNPIAAVKAFRAAFGSEPRARLVVKASNLHSFPQGADDLERALSRLANAYLISKVLDEAGVLALYSEADAVISLHRSEGFGLVVAEGMAAGLPAVSTDWSGTVDFVNVNNGMPVECRLIPAVDPQELYHFPELQWADPSCEDAASKLQKLRDPELRSALAEKARATAVELFSGPAYVRRASSILGLGREVAE